MIGCDPWENDIITGIYIQLRKKILKLEDEVAQYEPDFKENPNLAIKKIVDRIFKDFKRSV